MSNSKFQMPNECQKLNNVKRGFTIIELLISSAVGTLVLVIAYVSFVTGQKLYRRGILNAELSQNGRIALDRTSREIRQTGQVVTVLSPTPPTPAQNEIKFEDGHTDTIQYIRYYLSGSELKREQGHYYFPSEPSAWVDYDAKDGYGAPANYMTDLDQVVAQNITFINFYGEKVIGIDLTVERDGKDIQFRTKNLGRNL